MKNKLFEHWKWKLISTIVCTLYFSIPTFFSWSKINWQEKLFIFTVLPVLAWIIISVSMEQSIKNKKHKNGNS
jgi:hypothetical protein